MRNIFFPTTIIDGFFENPDKIREFALRQEYVVDEKGWWPGKRTVGLHEISRPFFEASIQKIMGCFYNIGTSYNFGCEAFFQIVEKNYDCGWVHNDKPFIFSAIAYLTPGSTSGTSLFLKKNNPDFSDDTYMNEKIEAYKQKTNNKESCELHNENFEESLHVKGIYNRVMMFDSSQYHAAHDFFGEDEEDSRLTAIFFVRNIECSEPFPIQRTYQVQQLTTI